jgi:2'-5' RNA ligase
MYRLFVAIDLPESLKAQLALIGTGIPGARWVPEDQLHLTLRFIGEVDGLLYRDIKKALFDVNMEPFPLALKGVGTFPPRGQPNVLWVGLEKSDPLLRLQHKIENMLRQAGVEPEGRKFSPHITLARLKDTPMSRLGNFLQGHALFQTTPFEVTEFYLYSSTLSSKGATHYKEETYPLEGDTL